MPGDTCPVDSRSRSPLSRRTGESQLPDLEEKLAGPCFATRLIPFGGLEHQVRIVRKTALGYALAFCDLDIGGKERLWQYIADRLGPSDDCPFCGQRFAAFPARCKTCGWDLVFDRQNYFEYREKTAVFKRLETKVGELPVAQLQKLIDFVDVDLPEGKDRWGDGGVRGDKQAMLQVFSKIRKVAKTDLSVLILGESGTGKEFTALAIHERRSPRKAR